MMDVGVVAGKLLMSGVLPSLLASVIAWCFGVQYMKCRYRSRYSRYLGTYDGYQFSKSVRRKLEEAPTSKAIVSRKADNVLFIKVSHQARTWFGEISMDADNIGSLVWRYTNLPDDKREFGFKRCVFLQDEIYLIGERPEYGTEVLRKT